MSLKPAFIPTLCMASVLPTSTWLRNHSTPVRRPGPPTVTYSHLARTRYGEMSLVTRYTTTRRLTQTESEGRRRKTVGGDEMEPYDPALRAIHPKRLSLGCQTIYVYGQAELASGQIGYSVSPTG